MTLQIEFDTTTIDSSVKCSNIQLTLQKFIDSDKIVIMSSFRSKSDDINDRCSQRDESFVNRFSTDRMFTHDTTTIDFSKIDSIDRVLTTS